MKTITITSILTLAVVLASSHTARSQSQQSDGKVPIVQAKSAEGIAHPNPAVQRSNTVSATPTKPVGPISVISEAVSASQAEVANTVLTKSKPKVEPILGLQPVANPIGSTRASAARSEPLKPN